MNWNRNGCIACNNGYKQCFKCQTWHGDTEDMEKTICDICKLKFTSI